MPLPSEVKALPLWLLKYWKVLLPAAIAVGMGIWVGILKIEVAGLETTVASMEAAKQKEIAEARAKIIQAQAEDQALNKSLADTYRARVVGLAEELANAKRDLEATAPSMVCRDSDAGRAFSRGLRSNGSGQAVPR